MDKYDPKLVTTVGHVFDTFDQDQKGSIRLEEVGNAIRALGVYATEAEIRNFIMLMSRETACQTIGRDSFVDFMCELLAKDECQGPSREELEAAFMVLDTENKGRLDENALGVQLASQGERFSADEVEQFSNFARDHETGQIDWRGYVDTVVDILWKNQ